VLPLAVAVLRVLKDLFDDELFRVFVVQYLDIVIQLLLRGPFALLPCPDRRRGGYNGFGSLGGDVCAGRHFRCFAFGRHCGWIIVKELGEGQEEVKNAVELEEKEEAGVRCCGIT
jgi:hypothetical protein